LAGTASAYDYTNAFDFTQPPLQPVHMTSAHISDATRAEVRRLGKFWRRDPP
jgi:hypothetical protein